MSGVRVSESQVQGFGALTLENGLIALTIVPELGGKITSLRDARTGREWLWASDRLPYRKLEYGVSYVEEADTGGWDECFPTVAACAYPLSPWRGAPMPDHGELWPQAWSVETVADDATGGVSVRTRARGVRLPYTFARAVSLDPESSTVRLDYEVTSESEEEIAYIWSAHPLFAIEPGMRVELPPDAVMRPYSTVPPDLLSEQGEYTWPLRVERDGRELGLARLPDASAGVAFKLWSEPLSEGRASLVARDGALRFSFDPRLVPQVGLWANLGGWSGTGGEPYYNLGLEPCIGAQDSLEEAVERYGLYATLPPRGARAWWLEVSLLTSAR
jgi:galactose mutarotase-like enzyme